MQLKVKARSGLSIFFVVLTAGSAYFEHRILVLGGSIQNHLGLIFGLVWWVTVSSIVARLALREGIGDVSAGAGRLGRAQSRLPAQCRLSWDSPHMESPGVQVWRGSKHRHSLVLFWDCILRLPKARS